MAPRLIIHGYQVDTMWSADKVYRRKAVARKVDVDGNLVAGELPLEANGQTDADAIEGVKKLIAAYEKMGS